MARIRSPNYPAISLPEAIGRIKAIHDEEQHLAAPKDVIAKHLGFGGLNGGSARIISALTKYGLLEEAAGDKMKLSALAKAILFPRNDAEKATAIAEAAKMPSLFAEISEEWEGAKPSDANLRSYLTRRNFAADAIDRVIASYRETIDLVTQESAGYAVEDEVDNESDVGVNTSKPNHGEATQPQRRGPVPYETTFSRDVGEEPFRVTFTGKGIEISGRITDLKSADDLVNAINALKLLLRPAGNFKRPDDEVDEEV